MKRFISAAIWLLAFAVCLLGLNHAMGRRDGRLKYQAFFEDEAGFDVFFMGTSHVMDAVYPIELWRDFGITAYNFGNTAEAMDMTYWTLRLAAEYHKPKVAVIDVCYLDRRMGEANTYQFSHGFLDEIPLSKLKLQAIWSVFPEGRRAEFVFPLALYHTRWEEIIAGDFAASTSAVPCMFGAELRVGRSEPSEFVRTTEMIIPDEGSKRILAQMISFCQEQGIIPVLTAIPYPADAYQQKIINGAQVIAAEYGVPFLNLFEVKDLVDFETDCYDAASHLNPDGAAKVTAYLGKWLTEQYGLEDKRGEEAYSHWDAALAEYELLWKERWGGMTLL